MEPTAENDAFFRLGLRQETFCRLIAIDKVGVQEAYAKAGFRPHVSNAYRMLNKPECVQRIEQLREQQRVALIDAASISVALLTSKLLKVAENVYPLTTKMNATAAAAAAAYRGLLMDAARLNSLIVERTHAIVERRDIQQYTDEELTEVLRHQLGQSKHLTIEHEQPPANGHGDDHLWGEKPS